MRSFPLAVQHPDSGVGVAIRRLDPAVLLTVPVLLALGLCLVIPSSVAPSDPNAQDVALSLRPPALYPPKAFSLGTDNLGRDIFSRIIFGTRTSLGIASSATLLSALVGIALGLLAGSGQRLIDDLVMRVADVQLAFPFSLLTIGVVAVLGPSIPNLILVLGFGNWVTFARVVRAEVLELRERGFIRAAEALGASHLRIVLRYLLPNLIPSCIVLSTFGVAYMIVTEAGLSFLGLGVPPSVPSWGGMLADGREFIATAWWMVVFPGSAIFASVLSINLLGDQLRDFGDPKLR